MGSFFAHTLSLLLRLEASSLSQVDIALLSLLVQFVHTLLVIVLFSTGKSEADMDCERGKSSSNELLQGLKVDTFDTGVEDSLCEQLSEEV